MESTGLFGNNLWNFAPGPQPGGGASLGTPLQLYPPPPPQQQQFYTPSATTNVPHAGNSAYLMHMPQNAVPMALAPPSQFHAAWKAQPYLNAAVPDMMQQLVAMRQEITDQRAVINQLQSPATVSGSQFSAAVQYNVGNDTVSHVGNDTASHVGNDKASESS